MKNTEFLRQKIKIIEVFFHPMNSRKGQAEWMVGLFFTLFLTILLYVQLQIEAYRSASLYLEDALAASNLASAVIDMEAYGISHELKIEDPWESYMLYKNALKENLGLDDSWESHNQALISGRVEVETYMIYQVKGEEITFYRIDADGRMETGTGQLGDLAAPNGVLIESTGVYSEVSFPIKGFLGVTVQAHKGKLADVVINK